MRFIIAAALAVFAATATAQTAQFNDREAWYNAFNDNRGCLNNLRDNFPRIPASERVERCECLRRYMADNLPGDLILRGLDEARGINRPASPDEFQTIMARIMRVAEPAHLACGITK